MCPDWHPSITTILLQLQFKMINKILLLWIMYSYTIHSSGVALSSDTWRYSSSSNKSYILKRNWDHIEIHPIYVHHRSTKWLIFLSPLLDDIWHEIKRKKGNPNYLNLCPSTNMHHYSNIAHIHSAHL